MTDELRQAVEESAERAAEKTLEKMQGRTCPFQCRVDCPEHREDHIFCQQVRTGAGWAVKVAIGVIITGALTIIGTGLLWVGRAKLGGGP